MKKSLLICMVTLVVLTAAIQLSRDRLGKNGWQPENLACHGRVYRILKNRRIPLVERLLLLEKEEYTDLRIQNYLDFITLLAGGIEDELEGVRDPKEIIKTVNRNIFEKYSFGPGEKGRGFTLHDVIDSRKGNCFGLTALYLSVTDSLNLPFSAVCAPGHIFVRYDDGNERINIETTLVGEPCPDAYYIWSDKITSHSLRKKAYLQSLSNEEFLADYLFILMIKNCGGKKIKWVRERCDLILHVNPRLVQVLMARARAYIMAGDFRMALPDLDRALDLNPNESGAYMMRGIANRELARIDEAIRDFNRALLLGPKSARLHYLRADAYESTGWYDRAIKGYNRALELAPAMVKAYKGRGYSHLQFENLDEAIEDFSMVLSIEPDCAISYNSRGVAYSKKGDFDRALQDLQRALSLDPHYVSAYLNRGIVNKKKGAVGQALNDYAMTLELDPECIEAYLNRGELLRELSRYDQAVSDFSRVIELQPGKIKAYCQRALCYYSLGEFDLAVEDYQKVVACSP